MKKAQKKRPQMKQLNFRVDAQTEAALDALQKAFPYMKQAPLIRMAIHEMAAQQKKGR